MAVAIVGTPAAVVDGGSYTAETGSNRVVVFAFGAESAVDGRTLTSVTYGGVTMTQAVYIADEVTSNNNNHAGIYYLKEADIPTGSQAFDATWSDTMVNEAEGIAYTLDDVDQTTSVGATNSVSWQAAPSATHELSVVSTDNSVAIIVDYLRSTAVLSSITSLWTKDLEGMSSGDGIVMSRAFATGSTADAGAVWTTSRDGALVSAVFAAASASGTLTDVDTDEAILAGQTSIAYTGTGLTDADGMMIQTGTIGEAAATSFVATNDTSGTFTGPTLAAAVAGGVKFGDCIFAIEDGGVELATLPGTIAVSADYTLHTVSDISQAADADCIYNGWSPAAAVPDQIPFKNTSTLYGWAITIDAEGFPTFDAGGSNLTDSFTFYTIDVSTEIGTGPYVYERSHTPILGGTPTAVVTGDTTVTLEVTTDTAEGTMYLVVTTSGTAPSYAQVAAGTDNSDVAATYASNTTPTTTTQFLATGLTSNTTYYAHFAQKNAATTPGQSSVVSTASFTPGATSQNIWEWIEVLIADGGRNDKIFAYLGSLGYITGGINERMFNWLEDSSYSGGINDKILVFEKANTSRYS